MRIFYEKEINSTLLETSSVALGSFESLHAGHIKIIKSTVDCAKKYNIQSIVTIFKDPILKKRTAICETLEDRLSLLEKMNVDNVVIFEFDEKFSKITADDFFTNIILNKLGAKYIFAGFNYRFGHKASGDTEALTKLCSQNNINLNIIPAVKKGTVISSTHIYELITEGKANELFNCLLRPYSLNGKVTSGRQIGRQIGFPTANIEIPDNKAVIAAGVYFGKCHFCDCSFFCIINVGLQPTVTTEITPKIECHILDFNGDIYGKIIKVEFFERLRDIKTFKNAEELKIQLDYDKTQAYNLLKKYI